MLKDSRKIVANWLVRLLGSMPSSAVACTGVMSLGCGLKGNFGGVFRLIIGIEPRHILVGVVG
jgi:hypothetical protein